MSRRSQAPTRTILPDPKFNSILLAKFSAVLVLMVWIRWTLPRFRVDQVMRLCWLTLVPLCLVALFGLALTMLLAALAVPDDQKATILGAAFGRIEPLHHLVLTPLGHALAWIVPLSIAGVLVVLARRKFGRPHPALRLLTEAPQ